MSSRTAASTLTETTVGCWAILDVIALGYILLLFTLNELVSGGRRRVGSGSLADLVSDLYGGL